MLCRVVLTAFLCVAFAACPLEVAAGESSAKSPTEDQIRKWVKDLDAEEFQLRQDAEAALKKAGPSAIPFVKAAIEQGGAEVKVRGRRVLDQLGWSVLPTVKDLTNILPTDTVLLLHTPGLKATAQHLRSKSAAGKFYDNAALTDLKSMIGRAWVKSMKVSPQDEKTIVTWLDRYGGPYGLCLLGFDTSGGWPREEMAFVFGLTDPDPKKAYKDFVERFPIRTWGQSEVLPARYRGVDYVYRSGQYGRDAMGLVKNLIVRTTGPSAIKSVVACVADRKAASLATEPTFKEAMARVGTDALASFYFSWENMVKKAGQAIRPRERAAFTGLGLDEWKYAGVSLKAGDDGLIEERAFCKVSGERKGLAKLLSMPATSGKHAALCPKNALAFVSLPLDGKDTYKTVIEMARKVDQRDTERFEKEVEEVEMRAGVKIADDLLASIKGESAIWCLRPLGAAPSPYPELGAVIEAADANAAKKLADDIAKLLRLFAPEKDALKESAYKGRQCRWLPVQTKDMPYTPSWCVDGNRLLASSSQEGLQRLIRRIDASTPGLDKDDDFKRLFAKIPAQERGGMIYVNTERSLGWAYKLCLPIVTSLVSEETAAELKDAPQDVSDLLKGFSGTLFSVVGVEDGVEARSYGGLPTSGLVFTTPFAVMVQYKMVRRKARAEAKARAVAKEQAAKERAMKEAKEREKKLAAEEAARKKAEAEKKKAEENK